MRALAVLLLLATTPAVAQSQATECDRLAGYHHTPRLPGLPGVAQITDPAAAIAACEGATQDPGADPFLRLLLARAYEAADPADLRLLPLVESARDAHPLFATGRLARLHAEGLGGLPVDTAQGEALNLQVCARAPDPMALAACHNLALDDIRAGVDLPQSVALMETTCAQGFGMACLNLAYELGEGGALPPDPVRQTELFIASCELGQIEACDYAGWALDVGDGVPQDQPRAAGFYARACDAGYEYSCYGLGYMEIWGNGIPRDWARGMERLAGVCAGGLDDACYDRGLELAYGMDAAGDVTPEGQAEAVATFQRLCAIDHAQSCTELGFLHQDGTALAQDSGVAMGFNTRGCDLGDMMGCNNLGAHHDEAQGVPRDAARAQGYYQQACDGGIGLACANLARLVETEGLGAPDPAALRARACELGQADSCP